MENNLGQDIAANSDVQPQPSQVDLVEPVKKKSKKWLVVIAVILVLLLGVTGGGYFFWKNYKIMPKIRI